jgi:hypothetical protein
MRSVRISSFCTPRALLCYLCWSFLKFLHIEFQANVAQSYRVPYFSVLLGKKCKIYAFWSLLAFLGMLRVLLTDRLK